MCEVARSDNTKLYSQFKMALGTKKPSNNGGLNTSFISTQVINKSYQFIFVRLKIISQKKSNNSIKESINRKTIEDRLHFKYG